MRTRTLKIEEAGDAHRYGIVPKIRISGKWLEAAGFQPGHRVTVALVSPGVIELRSATAREPSPDFHIAAMRLDHAIATDMARRANPPGQQ